MPSRTAISRGDVERKDLGLSSVFVDLDPTGIVLAARFLDSHPSTRRASFMAARTASGLLDSLPPTWLQVLASRKLDNLNDTIGVIQDASHEMEIYGRIAQIKRKSFQDILSTPTSNSFSGHTRQFEGKTAAVATPWQHQHHHHLHWPRDQGRHLYLRIFTLQLAMEDTGGLEKLLRKTACLRLFLAIVSSE